MSPKSEGDAASLPGLALLSRELVDFLSVAWSLVCQPSCGGGALFSRKICTVSDPEETQRRVEVALKDMLNIRAGIEPLRN